MGVEGAYPRMVSSGGIGLLARDKGDPRRGGQAQERARRRTVGAPHKQATSTADAARGSLVAAEKAAAFLSDRRLRQRSAPPALCRTPCARLRRADKHASPCSVVLRGLTAHPLRLGCRPSGGRLPASSLAWELATCAQPLPESSARTPMLRPAAPSRTRPAAIFQQSHRPRSGFRAWFRWFNASPSCGVADRHLCHHRARTADNLFRPCWEARSRSERFTR